MLKNIYNQTITVLNKLRRSDSLTGRDVWYKTIINDAVWYTDSARSAGNSTVYIGSYITVLVPFHDDYLDYLEWRKFGKQDDYFTISVGDYVVKGIVEEEITAENIIKVLETYGENVCYVRHHNANHDRFGARVQLKIQGV